MGKSIHNPELRAQEDLRIVNTISYLIKAAKKKGKFQLFFFPFEFIMQNWNFSFG